MRSTTLVAAFIAICQAISSNSTFGAEARSAESFELRDGDHVVLIGGTYIERMQSYGYLETLITANYPDRNITFRNLGWSGDDASGIARAVFGSPADGFKRLRNDVFAAKPTVILVCYGANEAYAGKSGLPTFAARLTTLLYVLKETGARIALTSPMSHEKLGPPLPDPSGYNKDLRLYCDAIKTIAAERGHKFIDLYNRLPQIQNVSSSATLQDKLTDNGVHLNQYGYWRTAPQVARALGLEPRVWKLDVNTADNSYDAVGTMLSGLKISRRSVQFTAMDQSLPFPSPPNHSPRGANAVASPAICRIRGLEPGQYGLRIDDRPTILASDKQWSAGVKINLGAYSPQIEKLRQAIREKNSLYFHRYRPQNETYLFLFRKHEQGNNAVEIPQFDPMIEEKEKLIAKLRRPTKHVYRLLRLKQESSRGR